MSESELYDFGHKLNLFLKTLNPVGNCQIPVVFLGVSQHMHKLTNLWKLELNRSSKLRDNSKRKYTPPHLCFQMLDFEISNSKFKVSKSNSWKITSCSKTTLILLIIILSNYQYCPLHLMSDVTPKQFTFTYLNLSSTLNPWQCLRVFKNPLHSHNFDTRKENIK